MAKVQLPTIDFPTVGGSPAGVPSISKGAGIAAGIAQGAAAIAETAKFIAANEIQKAAQESLFDKKQKLKEKEDELKRQREQAQGLAVVAALRSGLGAIQKHVDTQASEGKTIIPGQMYSEAYSATLGALAESDVVSPDVVAKVLTGLNTLLDDASVTKVQKVYGGEFIVDQWGNIDVVDIPEEERQQALFESIRDWAQTNYPEAAIEMQELAVAAQGGDIDAQQRLARKIQEVAEYKTYFTDLDFRGKQLDVMLKAAQLNEKQFKAVAPQFVAENSKDLFSKVDGAAQRIFEDVETGNVQGSVGAAKLKRLADTFKTSELFLLLTKADPKFEERYDQYVNNTAQYIEKMDGLAGDKYELDKLRTQMELEKLELLQEIPPATRFMFEKANNLQAMTAAKYIIETITGKPFPASPTQIYATVALHSSQLGAKVSEAIAKFGDVTNIEKVTPEANTFLQEELSRMASDLTRWNTNEVGEINPAIWEMYLDKLVNIPALRNLLNTENGRATLEHIRGMLEEAKKKTGDERAWNEMKNGVQPFFPMQLIPSFLTPQSETNGSTE